jgi:hypothetical protein
MVVIDLARLHHRARFPIGCALNEADVPAGAWPATPAPLTIETYAQVRHQPILAVEPLATVSSTNSTTQRDVTRRG